jgi:hypothetical protein
LTPVSKYRNEGNFIILSKPGVALTVPLEKDTRMTSCPAALNGLTG